MSRLCPVSLEVFLGRLVHVKCCDDYEVEGILVGYRLNPHGRRHPEDYGIGSVGALVLNCGFGEWVLIKCWKAIYIKKCPECGKPMKVEKHPIFGDFWVCEKCGIGEARALEGDLR